MQHLVKVGLHAYLTTLKINRVGKIVLQSLRGLNAFSAKYHKKQRQFVVERSGQGLWTVPL